MGRGQEARKEGKRSPPGSHELRAKQRPVAPCNSRLTWARGKRSLLRRSSSSWSAAVRMNLTARMRHLYRLSHDCEGSPVPAGQWQHQPRACAVRMLKATCSQRSEALTSPPLDDAPKEYSPKIQQIVQDVASLTLLEIADLNELLKKTLKIQDIGLMPMAGMMPSAQPAAAAEEEEAPKKQEKLNFTVKLTEVKAAEKVKLIKEVKNCMQGLNLVQAKKLVESLPQEIKANVPKEEAEKIKTALEAAGGTVVLE